MNKNIADEFNEVVSKIPKEELDKLIPRFGEWINVKARLPNDLESCLFIHKKQTEKEPDCGYYDKTLKQFVCYSLGLLPPDEYEVCIEYLTFKKIFVTHWMPLPKPPEK